MIKWMCKFKALVEDGSSSTFTIDVYPPTEPPSGVQYLQRGMPDSWYNRPPAIQLTPPIQIVKRYSEFLTLKESLEEKVLLQGIDFPSRQVYKFWGLSNTELKVRGKELSTWLESSLNSVFTRPENQDNYWELVDKNSEARVLMQEFIAPQVEWR
tara:strand:+ start:103 stop:567 length:465 start_codon:yes stop_codon:yes gene_type:complete